VIRVVAVAGVATVQDGGRPGRMHEGVPPGGAFVPELLARANAAAHNEPGAAGLEVFGSVTLAADARTWIADDAGEARELGARETWTVGVSGAGAGAGARVRYVAVRGGLDVPLVLGGRGTLLGAGLGGHAGRLLRRGDAIPVGTASPVAPPLAAAAAPDGSAPVPVVPGPDLERFAPDALAVLLASTFHVDARSDRTGIRLAGPPLPRALADGDVAASAPMVLGALQVPPGGLIALGPDHPTTGGYPVLATVVRAAWGSLAVRPVGAAVRFALAPGPQTPWA
jgi:allophanate hydrolase subunit 2